MSKLGWATRIGGYAAAPFTAGFSVPAANFAASAIEKKQAANDTPTATVMNGGGGFDPKNPESGILGQLQQQGKSLSATGQQLGGLSAEALTPVLNYFKSLMGADPQALLDATRQDRGRVIDQYDTARRAIASFGPRGGGTTSALANSRFSQAESLADITSNARRDATTGAVQLGTQLAELGLSAEQLASADLGSIIQAVLAREGLNVEKRGQNMQTATGIGEAAGALAGLYLTREGGIWGPSKPATSGGTI